jgi:hypothetical protein
MIGALPLSPRSRFSQPFPAPSADLTRRREPHADIDPRASGRSKPSRRVTARALPHSVPIRATSLPRQRPPFRQAVTRKGTPARRYVRMGPLATGVGRSRTWCASPRPSYNSPFQPPSPGRVPATQSAPRTRLAANNSTLTRCAGATHLFMACLLENGLRAKSCAARRDDPASHRWAIILRGGASAHRHRRHAPNGTAPFVTYKPSMSVSSTSWNSCLCH